LTFWFDLCHPPHVLFFAPQIRALEKQGHLCFVTVRDRFQVAELCGLHGINPLIVGHDYGKRSAGKAAGFLIRTAQLIRACGGRRLSLAVSQGSTYQVVAASLLGMPSVFMTDYEHVFLGVANRFATRLFFPSAIPPSVLRDRGVPPSKIVTYPGLKEDAYVHEFRPDTHAFRLLKIRQDSVIVVLRAPSFSAHYRNPESETLFFRVAESLLKRPRVSVLFLPRSPHEGETLRRRFSGLPGRLVVADRAVDALNWIWHSDLVVGGGGTMNREAAALGVPVYSIFRGRSGAVDRYLNRTGRLAFIENASGLERIRIEKRIRRPVGTERKSLTAFLAGELIRAARGER
jgi:predicted glycosyltransferase